VDVTGKKETLAFFEQSNSMGDVIPLVNSFAGDINMKMFNRNIDNKLYVQQQQEPQAPGGLQFAGGAGMYGGGMMAMQGSQGFTTHLKVKDIIRGMVTGDLNNDGKTQVVTAADNKLMFYRVEGTMLVLEETLEYESYIRIIALDLADINGNGYPELFVSALTVHLDTIESFVVEYNGTTYTTLVEDESYYYRVVTTNEGNQVLLAQDKGKDPFDGRIHVMSPQGDAYTEEKRIRMPRGTSVLSLAKGPVRGENSEEYLTINRHNRLVAVNDAGGMEWESTNKYGKSNNFWLMPKSAAGGEGERDRMYMNPRVKFHALGEDETAKAFVVRNFEVGGGAFGRIKRFKEGYIEIMAWNGIAMAPVFQTMPVQGWISDFDVADIDGDGNYELIVSVVSRSKITILSSDKGSNIISYKLK
ncbi:MAG: VCBS repeat-containing protein, partial [Desulfobacterales bacterium]|nr:VCBS repeat-containing protein [Desulfobacterales bacterium]